MTFSPHTAGFTLVEVMVALALLATVTTAMWSTMATSFETKDRVLEINERYHEGRQMMTRMSRELRMAFLRAEVPEEFREEEKQAWPIERILLASQVLLTLERI